MNPRQRILAAIHHQPVDRFPTDMWATHEVWEKLYRHYNITGRLQADRLALYDQMGIDGILEIAPPYIGPELPVKEDIRYDEWQMGIDILNPIQWRCGNWDLDAMKTEFGDQVCFHSAVDNQQTLPFGNPENVRAEVHRLAETLGRDRTGLILAPCHNLQSITPLENIIALYQAARSA